MYTDFFGLNCNPFQLSPDPFFMVSSDRSKEALTAISSAVGQRKGFVVMTGEVGTGKTLVLRCLFELWEREQIPFAYFIGPKLSTIDFLSYINFELGIKVNDPTKGNLLRALYGYLLAQFEKGLTTVLIIDEAHEMPRTVLEEIRLLTNFETSQQKLVQIVLVGQPELDRKLDSVELRSLKQRIAVRCRLEPLRPEEIRGYIERRLDLAGANTQAATIFPVETAKAIYRYSRGLPRLINNICDQALIAACASQIRVVPVEVIDEIASRFRLEPVNNLKQTERIFSPPTLMESFDPDKSWLGAPASHVPSAKAPDPDTVLLYLDVNNGSPAQTTPLGKSETSLRNNSSNDSSPYTREPRQDHDTIPEVLSELALQWNVAAKDVRLPSNVSALSDARSSVITTSEPVPQVSSQNSALVSESIYLAPKPAQLTVSDPVIAPSDIQTSPALPKTAPPREREVPVAKNPPAAQAEKSVAVAPVPQPARHTSVEIIEIEAVQPQPEKTIEPDQPSIRNNQRILIGAAAAAFLVLASGSALYLRHRHNVTSTLPPVLTSAQIIAHSAVPPAQPAVSEKASSNPNSDLPANKDLAHPSPASKKSLLHHVRLAKPSLNRSSKSPDVADPGVAPLMDGRATSSADGLGSELATKQSLTPPPPIRVGGDVKPAHMISSVSPEYPSLAKNQRIGGDVRIDALIDANGSVSAMEVVSGPVILRDAAREALRQWKYQPATLDGKAVPTHLTVTIQFRLS